jgi:sensor histidine kinase YesM
MFPGLTEVSYFVLLTENGTSSYSSIYSNSKDIFNIDSQYLRQDQDMYWIASFPTVYEERAAAVVRRIDPGITGGNAPSYLLLVPKETLFSKVESGLLNAAYEIRNEDGQIIYRTSENVPAPMQEAQVVYENAIPATGWTITIRYVLNEVIEKTTVLQGQYLLFMLIVALLSISFAFVIANLLVKPIEQLKESMRASGAGDLSTRIDDASSNEIGDIIRSYNGMIARLERTIEQNMNMMEENAQNKIREKELLSMKTRAELLMLQAQINPHFLYNTLESISMQSMRSGNQEVSAIVGSLADMFRYSISKGSDIVELSKELEHVRHYLTIQQFRFGGSFEGRFDVPEELMHAPVLKFILQPLIENAIKHGFAGWEEGGWIVVSASAHDGWITLEVRDNGVGMSAAKLGKLRSSLVGKLEERTGEDGGIGLQNVYYRLLLFFQENMSVEVESVLMRGTTVRLSFPLDTGAMSGEPA